jgi:hypothetical protein
MHMPPSISVGAATSAAAEDGSRYRTWDGTLYGSSVTAVPSEPDDNGNALWTVTARLNDGRAATVEVRLARQFDHTQLKADSYTKRALDAQLAAQQPAAGALNGSQLQGTRLTGWAGKLYGGDLQVWPVRQQGDSVLWKVTVTLPEGRSASAHALLKQQLGPEQLRTDSYIKRELEAQLRQAPLVVPFEGGTVVVEPPQRSQPSLAYWLPPGAIPSQDMTSQARVVFEASAGEVLRPEAFGTGLAADNLRRAVVDWKRSNGQVSNVPPDETSLVRLVGGQTYTVSQPFDQRRYGDDGVIYQVLNERDEFELYYQSSSTGRSALAFVQKGRPVNVDAALASERGFSPLRSKLTQVAGEVDWNDKLQAQTNPPPTKAFSLLDPAINPAMKEQSWLTQKLGWFREALGTNDPLTNNRTARVRSNLHQINEQLAKEGLPPLALDALGNLHLPDNAHGGAAFSYMMLAEASVLGSQEHVFGKPDIHAIQHKLGLSKEFVSGYEKQAKTIAKGQVVQALTMLAEGMFVDAVALKGKSSPLPSRWAGSGNEVPTAGAAPQMPVAPHTRLRSTTEHRIPNGPDPRLPPVERTQVLRLGTQAGGASNRDNDGWLPWIVGHARIYWDHRPPTGEITSYDAWRILKDVRLKQTPAQGNVVGRSIAKAKDEILGLRLAFGGQLTVEHSSLSERLGGSVGEFVHIPDVKAAVDSGALLYDPKAPLGQQYRFNTSVNEQGQRELRVPIEIMVGKQKSASLKDLLKTLRVPDAALDQIPVNLRGRRWHAVTVKLEGAVGNDLLSSVERGLNSDVHIFKTTKSPDQLQPNKEFILPFRPVQMRLLPPSPTSIDLPEGMNSVTDLVPKHLLHDTSKWTTVTAASANVWLPLDLHLGPVNIDLGRGVAGPYVWRLEFPSSNAAQRYAYEQSLPSSALPRGSESRFTLLAKDTADGAPYFGNLGINDTPLDPQAQGRLVFSRSGPHDDVQVPIQGAVVNALNGALVTAADYKAIATFIRQLDTTRPPPLSGLPPERALDTETNAAEVNAVLGSMRPGEPLQPEAVQAIWQLIRRYARHTG